MPNLSLQAIAKQLGLSATAVSLALRGKPGVSDETRAKVTEYARREGYTPNAAAAELMAIVRSRRKKRHTESVAYVNTFIDPTLMTRIPAFTEFFDGAAARAAEFGYKLERFDARGPGLNPTRLSGILKARGVRGVLVGPRWRNEPDIEFDWEAFSVVLIGEAEYGAPLYRVCNHHVHTCALALRQLHERGYRRVAVVLLEEFESVRGHDYVLGVEQFRREGREMHIRVWSRDGGNTDAFRSFLKRERMDAVVTLPETAWEVVRTMKTPFGAPVGFVNLCLRKDDRCSGIDQHLEDVGATAFDLLRNQLLNAERGPLQRTRTVLVEGSWVDGGTTPALVRP